MQSGPQCYRPKVYNRFFTSVFAYMVLKERIELSIVSYQDTGMPFTYKSHGTLGEIRTHTLQILSLLPLPIGLRGHNYMVPPLGIEPSSTVLQTGAMTTFAKAAIFGRS